MAKSPSPVSDIFRLLRHRDFFAFWVGRFASQLAASAQAIIIAWQVYGIARRTLPVEQSALLVGLVGLAEFLPLFALTLISGEMADRRDRRLIVLACLTGQTVVASLFCAQSAMGVSALWPLFALTAAFGVARAFFSPANTALAPMLIPAELLPTAIAANSLVFQSAGILGPAVGGILCAISPTVGFAVCVGLYAVAAGLYLIIRADAKPKAQPTATRGALIREGLAYIWQSKIVLGAISLDLFAVLLGGATALLPVFSRDILHVGPSGFGLMRSAPAIGALATAVWLAARPIRRQAGAKMFLGVAIYGAMTLVFAFSRSFALSVAALVVLGAADMISVYVRQSLVQIVTPDHMRGRVSAVSTLFIGASNELGEFESGVVARFLGPIGAAIFGGVGALIVTAVWAKLFPALRKADRLV